MKKSLQLLIILAVFGLNIVAQPHASFYSSADATNDTVCVCKCIQCFNTTISSDSFSSFWLITSQSSLPDSSHQENPKICLTLPGDYTVKLIVTSIAGVDSFKEFINVKLCSKPVANISTQPHVDTICSWHCVQFRDSSCNTPTAWSWQFPGGIPSTSTMQNPPLICYNSQGTFTVKMVDTNSFGYDSAYYTIYVKNCTSINEIEVGIVEFSIYPNPASTLLNIHQSTPFPNQQLIITDLLGNEVYKEMLTGIDNTISISTWNAGIYFYEVRSTTGIARGKFVVQK